MAKTSSTLSRAALLLTFCEIAQERGSTFYKQVMLRAAGADAIATLTDAQLEAAIAAG